MQRTTETGQPRAKRTKQNAAALKAWNTRLANNPQAGRDAAAKAVATREANVQAKIKAEAAKLAARQAKAGKAKAKRQAKATS
jgi:hypothetical protein